MPDDDIRGPAAVSTKKDFGRALTRRRESAGLTVRELARRANAPAGTVSGWCTGRHLPTLAQKELFLRLLAACGVNDGADTQEWVACWMRLRRPLGQKEVESPAPYRGLESFQAEDAEWFFGRARLTDTLVRGITDGVSGLMMVVGPSGSGKSSVLRAGLMASLCGNGSARDPWQGLLLTPGQFPISALATQLAVLSDVAADVVEAELWSQPARAARRIRHRAAQPLLIVVDQFEEIFTDCADTAERGAFLSVLEELSGDVSRTDGRVRVVAGMRADFYPDALRWALLAEALQSGQVTVGPMTENELRQAIIEPVRVAGMEFENGLTHVLLRDLAPVVATNVTGAVGALPLLSHALLATWRQGQRGSMTIADYTATGGIRGAIAQTADAVFTDLTEAERALVRRLFLRLVHVGDNTPDTRRRVQLEELTGDPDDDGHARTRTVLGRYVDQRLITADADGVEISHEALLGAWPRLRAWIDTDRSGHRLHRQLTEAARAWRDADSDPGALYRGVRLGAAVDWVTDHQGELNPLEQQFVDASVRADRVDRLRERQRTRRLRWLAAALAALLVLAGAATVYSIEQRATADQERSLAVSRQVAGTANRLRDSDPALAAQLAVAAYRIAPTVEARSSVLNASGSPAVTRMLRPSGALQTVAVNPAGTLLAAGGGAKSDTAVLLWDLRDPDRPRLLGTPLTGHTAEIWAVDFSPDGTILATGGADNTVRLWDVTDTAHPMPVGQPLTGQQGEILTIDFSADGATLAAGTRDQTVHLWDVHDPARPTALGAPFTAAEGDVRSVAFSPDGKLLAIADERNAVHVWDIADRPHPRRVGAPLAVNSRPNTVAFSPDGGTLAAGSSSDASVYLWAVSDPAKPMSVGRLERESGWVNAIAFSADGKRLAAASAAASVQVWDLTRNALLLDLPHAEPVLTVAFREDDQVLYTGGDDGIARRWRVPGPVMRTADQVTGLDFHPHRPMVVGGGARLQMWDVSNRNHPEPVGPELTAPSDRLVGTVNISPDGRTVAAVTRAGNIVMVWDITDPEHPRPAVHLTGHTAQLQHVSFNRDGDLLVSASQDGTVRLWDMTEPHNPTPLAVLDPQLDDIFAAEFSRDGRLLAAVGESGNVLLWDVRDPRKPMLLGKPYLVAPDEAHSLAISPDSRTLAVGIADGTVRLLDIRNSAAPRPLRRITGPDGYINALMFNADGSILAGGGRGQTWLWHIDDQRQPETLAILQNSRTSVWKIQFLPDGQTLATADGTIQLRHIEPEHIIHEICATAGDKITPAEWEKHVPGANYQPICP